MKKLISISGIFSLLVVLLVLSAKIYELFDKNSDIE